MMLRSTIGNDIRREERHVYHDDCEETNDDVADILGNILQTVVLAPTARTAKKKKTFAPPPLPRTPRPPRKKKNNEDDNYHRDDVLVETDYSSPPPPPPPPPPPTVLPCSPRLQEALQQVAAEDEVLSSTPPLSRAPALLASTQQSSLSFSSFPTKIDSCSPESKLNKGTLTELLLSVESDRRMLKKCEECIRRYRIHRVFEKLDVNRRIQKQYKKSMNVAKQFHTFVVLSKYFETWHADTKRRRALICFYRNTLRKILLKWRCYAEEQNNRRKSCMIISETLTKIQFRKLQHILHVLSTHCWRYHVLKKVFREWRSIVTKHTMWQINTLLRFKDYQRRMILRHWNDAVQRRIWCRWRNYQRLKKVIKAWKKITEESIITWELQLQKADSYCEERLFHLVGRIFEHMRIRAGRKNHMRKAYVTAKKRRMEYQMRIILKYWKEYYEFQRKKGRILSRIISRRMIIGWRDYVQQKRKRERIQLQIILNRWRLITENKIDRRRWFMKATWHWSRRLCRHVLRNWRIVISKEYGRIRSPYPVPRRCSGARNEYMNRGFSSLQLNSCSNYSMGAGNRLKTPLTHDRWRRYNTNGVDEYDYYNHSLVQRKEDGNFCRSYKRGHYFGNSMSVDSYLEKRRMKERTILNRSPSITASSFRRKHPSCSTKEFHDTTSSADYYRAPRSFHTPAQHKEEQTFIPSHMAAGRYKSTDGRLQSHSTKMSNDFGDSAGGLRDMCNEDKAPKMPKWVARALLDRTARRSNKVTSSEMSLTDTGSIRPSQLTSQHSSSILLSPCYAEEKHPTTKQRGTLFHEHAMKDIMSPAKATFFSTSISKDAKLQRQDYRKLWKEGNDLKPFYLSDSKLFC